MAVQDVFAGLIALAALGYLVRKRLRSRGAACEGCAAGGCAVTTPPAQRGAEVSAPLVTIEGLDTGSRQGPPARTGSAASR